MKYLGIDYGTKKIGLATSDEDGRIAFPKSVIDNDNKIIENLIRVIAENGIEKVIIGDSKDYNMKDNEIMGDIYDLQTVIKEQLQVDVDLHLEILTSMQAEKMMGEKNEMIDASAAAIILQSYLDLENNKKDNKITDK